MNKQQIIVSIDRAILKLESANSTIRFCPGDMGTGSIDVDEILYQKAYVTGINTLRRFAPPNLAYLAEIPEKEESPWKYQKVLNELQGILFALKEDYQDDCLTTFEELVHANLFADILDQAKHLLDNGYKDAAAVTIGCTLESHLKALCTKNGIDITKDNGRAKTASELNTELRIASIYPMSQDRQVQAWLDIRNDAAHGNYDKVEKVRVEAMLSEFRNFLVRYPA